MKLCVSMSGTGLIEALLTEHSHEHYWDFNSYKAENELFLTPNEMLQRE